MASRRSSPGTTAALLTAVAAAVGGVLVAVTQLLGLALVLGAVLLVAAARLAPKTLAVGGLILVLFARTIEIASKWPTATYTDEIVIAYVTVVLVARRLMARHPVRKPPGIWLFVGFAVVGLLSSVASAVPLGIAAAGGILVVKGVLLYFALAQVDWTRDDVPRLARTGAWVLGIALFGALINLAAPAPWAAVFANTGRPQYRSFLPSLTGPFPHPLEFGNFVALAAIACAAPLLFGLGDRARTRGALPLFLISAVAAVLSFRRTAIFGMLAGLSYLVMRRRNASLLVMALLVLPVAGVVLYPVVHDVAVATYQNYVVQAEDNARTRMTVDSVMLAFQHFPFGVGFGRFGSAIASEEYSIEYLRLGYDAVYGLGSPDNPNNHGRFLTDTQWPAIVGETGIIGTACFVAGLWRILTTFRQAGRAADLPLRLLGVIGVGWSVHIVLESVAYPVFVTPPSSVMLFGLAAITYVILAGSPSGSPEPSEPAGPEAAAPATGEGPAAVPHPGVLVRQGAPARRRQPPVAGGEPVGDGPAGWGEHPPR